MRDDDHAVFIYCLLYAVYLQVVPVSLYSLALGEYVSGEINTGGGSATEGNVRAGNFIGRDNISYENNQYLQFIRDQVIEMKAKMLIMENEITSLRDDGRHADTSSRLQWGNIIAAVVIALALFYFGSGLFDLARELHTGNTIQQRIQEQRNHVAPGRSP